MCPHLIHVSFIWNGFCKRIPGLQQYWVILGEESFLSWEIGQIPPRPKTCQCLPSPLLHNSHSDWSLEPRRWENIWFTSKGGHALSSAKHSIYSHLTGCCPRSGLTRLTWRVRRDRNVMQADLRWGWREDKEIGCDATKMIGRHILRFTGVRKWGRVGTKVKEQIIFLCLSLNIDSNTCRVKSVFSPIVLKNNNMPGDHKITKWNYLKATAEVPTALNLPRKKGNNMPATDCAISISQTKHSVNKTPGCLGDLGQQIQIFTAGRIKAETSTATLSQGRLKQREAHLFSVYMTQWKREFCHQFWFYPSKLHSSLGHSSSHALAGPFLIPTRHN